MAANDSDDVRDTFVAKLHMSINRKWFFWIALAFGVVFNIFFFLRKSGAWNDPMGGAAAWWHRWSASLTPMKLASSPGKLFELLLKPLRQAGLIVRSDSLRVRDPRLKEDCNGRSCRHAESIF